MSDQLPSDPVVDPAQGTDWKAEARKWEERSKENKSALDAITRERDEAVAKATGLANVNGELVGKVSAFESEKAHGALVSKVADSVGVDAKALRGTTEEELTEHATYLKTLIGSQPSAPVIHSQGKSPDNVQDDPLRELARSLFENKE